MPPGIPRRERARCPCRRPTIVPVWSMVKHIMTTSHCKVRHAFSTILISGYSKVRYRLLTRVLPPLFV